MFLIISALLQQLCVCFAPVPCLCIKYVTHYMVALCLRPTFVYFPRAMF